jgi:hypothetical protein
MYFHPFYFVLYLKTNNKPTFTLFLAVNTVNLLCDHLDHYEQILRPKPSEESFDRDEIMIMVARFSLKIPTKYTDRGKK